MFGIVGLTLLRIAAPALFALGVLLALVAGASRPLPPSRTASPPAGDPGASEKAQEREDRGKRYDRVAPAVIAVAFYLLGLWRLGVPGEMIFDEVHHARTSAEFVAGQNPHEWTHPHLAKLAAAASMMAWDRLSGGDGTVGGGSGVLFDPRDGVWRDQAVYPLRAAVAWRFPSLVFGALSLVVLYKLALALFDDRRVATLASCLLGLDGAFFVMSRVAMTNIYTVFFVLLATLGTVRHLRTGSVSWLWLTGFGLGCALSSRWSSLYAWALTLLALALWRGCLARRRPPGGALAPLPVWFASAVGALFVLPVVLYALTYVPFVLQGEGGTYAQKLFTWNHDQHGWGKVLSMQTDMYNYHSRLKDGHTYASPWWSWPLMLRPVWYYWREVNGGAAVAGVWCIGNAFLWWGSVPALLGSAWFAVRGGLLSRRPAPEATAGASGFTPVALGLVSLLGLGLWLLWGVKGRSLNFMHYMFEAIPFACLALAFLLVRIWDAAPSAHAETDGGDGSEGTAAPAASPAPAFDAWRGLVAFFCALVFGWFVFYYPLLSALPIPHSFFQAHLWLGRPWI